jgi:uncharacterized protein HemX
MRKHQEGFGVAAAFVIVAVAVSIGLTDWYLLQTKSSNGPAATENNNGAITQPPTEENTPRQNKEIEIAAAAEKNPAKCDEIKGESYRFGPRDEQIYVSEAEAKQQCRENIEHGITPVLHGG